MESLTVFETRVSDYARTPSGTVSQAQISRAVQDALRRHSSERPQTLTSSFSSGSSPYNLADIVPAWSALHRVLDIFYVDSGRKRMLDCNEWGEFFDGTDRKLLIASTPCGTSGTLYLVYSAPHTMDGTGSTIDGKDIEFVGKLAAANACAQAAQEAADEDDPTVAVDSVNYQSQIDNWLKLERRYRKEYESHISRNVSAGQFVEWDILDECGNPPLFHGGTDF